MNIDQAAEEIKAIFTEAEFSSRWILIEAYHEVGKIIIANSLNDKDVQGLALQVGKSERLLQYAKKFALTYKKLDDLPEGKNISFNKVIRKYLTEPKEVEEHKHTPITICSGCRLRLDTE